MPTVILLDNSLSMSKYVKGTDKTTYQQLSFLIIKQLADYFSKTDKLEYLALVTFSSTSQVVSEFTRDYTKIIDSLKTIKPGDCSCLEEGLNKTSDLVLEEWACFTNTQVLLITNDQDNLHYGSVKNLCGRLRENKVILKDYYLSLGIDFDEALHVNAILNEDILNSSYFKNLLTKKSYSSSKYPFAFPNKFDMICLVDSEYDLDEDFLRIDSSTDKTVSPFGSQSSLISFDEDNFQIKKWQATRNFKLFYLNELSEQNNSTGSIYVTKLRTSNENTVCRSIFNDLFKQFSCKIKCGHLESNAYVVPAPIQYKGYQHYLYVEKTINKTFEVCGFINNSDLTIPPTVSKHLIVPINEVSNEEAEDTTSFMVLLHSCLKYEGMAAVVSFDNDWYGAISCSCDPKSVDKKKTYLMLTVFVPGTDTIQNLIKTAQNSKTATQPGRVGFPIKSYTKGCIVWYRPDNLVSDLQKIIRNAKKMHDKMAVFYKELNKVRKAALSFGFYELFDGLVKMLQRELTSPSNSNNQEMIVQLNHCIFCLSSPEFRDFRKDIQPFVPAPMFARK